ncbi:hypothetical protein F5880DRAFT_1583491 [Lentinula raphanica]|nr:hypothetical protein F5880DRAFT_1583491 [Lentinula raphanica]
MSPSTGLCCVGPVWHVQSSNSDTNSQLELSLSHPVLMKCIHYGVLEYSESKQPYQLVLDFISVGNALSVHFLLGLLFLVTPNTSHYLTPGIRLVSIAPMLVPFQLQVFPFLLRPIDVLTSRFQLVPMGFL